MAKLFSFRHKGTKTLRTNNKILRVFVANIFGSGLSGLVFELIKVISKFGLKPYGQHRKMPYDTGQS